MCINWTKQLNWGWDPYFVRGVKTEMSYIAVNEVKSTTIKNGKGRASPNIWATLFRRRLWSKLESKGSLACGRFCRLGSLSSGRYVLLVLVVFFFSCREILNHLSNTRPGSPLFWFRSHHIYPGKRLITVLLLFIADYVWPWSAMVWPWCMTAYDHGMLWALDHGTLPIMVTKWINVFC